MKSLISDQPNWLRVISVVLLFSLTILAVSMALLMYFGKSNESDAVAKDNYQAVFLTNGQVYFGKVKALGPNYIDLRDIYYLNSQEQSAGGNEANTNNSNNTFSLVKLGCELHGPSDQMVVNRDQVTFWENLTSDGKVVKAIDEWKKQNPKGQDCSQTSNSTQQSSSTPTGTTGNNEEDAAN